ncbi:MAG: DUF4424 family protein [Rhodoferax sp.]|nr:DUF4424 family protein [Rhodoferax sp.]MDP3652790.1 DUF4424 family protein [Rhodoferax sp.]
MSANDSFARIGTGGLTLIQNSQVRMLEENLEISTKAVRVRYRFLNEGPNDIRATVAFPMPPYQLRDDGCEEQPLRDFKVTVDGKPIQTKPDFKAELSGRDVTGALRKIGLTESQIFYQLGNCHDAENDVRPLTKKQAAAVARLGNEKNRDPQWRMIETYYWEQTFPAGREIEVQHDYKPLVGSTYNAPYQNGHLVTEELPTAFKSGSDPDPKEACMDDALRKSLIKRAQTLGEGRNAIWVWASFQDVEYILGTGRNWKGPIGQFTLRIKKESPDQVVSLCFPGKPKKIDPLTIEFTEKDFIPQDRLVVYFYTISASYQITPKTLAAAAPRSVHVVHTSSEHLGAQVIALTGGQADITEFMRQLKEAGAPSVKLLEWRNVDACSLHLLRADLQIEGDSSGLRYVPQVPEFADIRIPVNGQLMSCKVRLRQP